MKCPGCGFENMPGYSKCFRCGAILSGDQERIDVNPPRMPRWKRPVRAFRRYLRKKVPGGSIEIQNRLPAWLDPSVADTGWFFLSVIPGLGHFIFGRLRQVWLFLCAWVAAVILALVFFGGSLGTFFAVSAAGIHAYIAVSLTAVYRFRGIRERLVLNLVVTFLYLGLYVLILRGGLGIRSMRAADNYPGQNIETGDVLIVTRVFDVDEHIRRGSIVRCRLYHPQRYSNSVVGLGQVTALPGETVSISRKGFIVNGVSLSAEAFPVPGYIHTDTQIEITLQDGVYFVNAPYNLNYVGRRFVQNYIHRMCCISGENILGKARVVWIPFEKTAIINDIDIQGIQ
ncbi:hypothetical protein SMSP2_02090 [Limihaloglobus sulfuriphilus]|uniref:Signal peptidase I n=1 Tax=Limihaloglobus sulfuriphilus TaxID=1851148 RepID=A0A1R7T5S9_9BACT|nr:hypothetical protein [Limihaloglobus sulfuriphilus]AQQ71713.1 hypothetical protein SMSP2_02090 [Limihaloglobus sulfuriphilus]